MNKHKLDILLEDLVKCNRASNEPRDVIIQYRTFKRDYNMFVTEVRMTINKVDVWFESFLSYEILTEEKLYELKNHWYIKFIQYLTLVRLPIWESSMSQLTIKTIE